MHILKMCKTLLNNGYSTISQLYKTILFSKINNFTQKLAYFADMHLIHQFYNEIVILIFYHLQ